MYHYLSRAVKKRLMETLRFCFDANPRHRDVVKHIREKYEFSERPQKGIVLQSASANPMSLAADNYIGTMYSYIMLAKVDDHRGTALEWVREDTAAVEEYGGNFPSEPGVYYVQIEDITPTGDVPEFQFWVDPLLSVLEEPIIEFQTGTETSAILAYAPVLEGSVRLYAYPDHLLHTGKALRLTAAQSLYIGGGNTNILFGFDEGYVPVSVKGSNTQPYTIISGSNDVFAFEINGMSVSVTLTAGNFGAADVADEIEAAIVATGLDGTLYSVDVVSNAVEITASQSLRIEDDATSTANPTLGFTSGYVAPEVTGLMVQPHVPKGSTIRLEVDGTAIEYDLREGTRPVEDIALELENGFAVTSLAVGTEDAGDYTLDASTGEITFLRSFTPGTQVIADYRYPVASRGPYYIGGGEVSNNEAIPGVVLAFGKELEGGDAMAVVVEEKRSDVADVYGGKIDMSIDFDIIARDSMTRGELADLVVMYLWQWRRERLAEEGLILNSVSFGGESEEPYDDTGDDYYYLANISLSLMTDWEIYIAKPLFIKRITPESFDQDARGAVADDGILLERPDNMDSRGENNLNGFGLVYVVDSKGDLEKIR